MDSLTLRAIEKLILNQTACPAQIVNSRSVGGGCINDAQVIALADGREFFVKSNSAELVEMFECEAVGLRAIEETGAIRVPEVVGVGVSGQHSYLVLEKIESRRPSQDFFQNLGSALAKLHRVDVGPRFGFEANNFLGKTLQPNSFNDDWCEFWDKHRLGFQLQLAEQNGYGGSELQKLGQKLISKLGSVIGFPVEPPCLLHGDLWSGNYLSDENGLPVLVDPAVYYGRREAEFGMTTLFGGFDQEFYDAYEEVWPWAEDAEERIEIYRLYHLLNHLNLFGLSYLDDCFEILNKYK